MRGRCVPHAFGDVRLCLSQRGRSGFGYQGANPSIFPFPEKVIIRPPMPAANTLRLIPLLDSDELSKQPWLVTCLLSAYEVISDHGIVFNVILTQLIFVLTLL